MDSTTSKTAGSQIRALRERQEITLRGMASKVGCEPSYLSKVERGLEKASEPFLFKVGSKLGLSLGEIDALICHAGHVPQDIRVILFHSPYLCEEIRLKWAINGASNEDQKI